MKAETIEHVESVALGAVILAVFAVVFFFAGCACTSCRGDVTPTPQSQAAPGPWRAAPQPPAPSPGIPRNDFETPPTDGGPDPTAPVPPNPAPTAPPAPPAPPPPPAPVAPPPFAPGRARTTATAETEGGNIINSNSGTIYLNSPGLTPGTAPASSVVMAAPQIASYPILPGPLPDAQAVGLARRLLGGLYYLKTGLCPTKPAAAIPASMAYMAVPQTTMAMVPVPTMQMVQSVQSVPMMVQQAAPVMQAAPMVMQAPAPAQAPVYFQQPQPAVMATPQFAAPPDLTRKCWFFKHK